MSEVEFLRVTYSEEAHPDELRVVDRRETPRDDITWFWSEAGRYALISVLTSEDDMPEAFSLRSTEEEGSDLFEHPYYNYHRAAGRAALSTELIPLSQAA